MADKHFVELLHEMEDLHNRKSAGYAGAENKDAWANFRMSSMFGINPFHGCLVRISDKFIRISNLAKNPANNQVNESMRDTLLDLASYALIAICLMEEKNAVSATNVGTDKLPAWPEFKVTS